MNEKEIYEKGIRIQKSMGWMFVVVGTVFTLSILFAIFGIPLLIIGIVLVKSKEVAPFAGWCARNQMDRI